MKEEKTYWRSFGQLADSPAFRKFVEREFPEGASEPPDGIPRRQMLMLLGASLSLAGLAACRRPVEKIVPFASAPEEMIPGIPRYYATTMPFGHSAYGLVVESHEGRPTKIEGNRLHPSTRGTSSIFMQASILGLYDPDRSTSVVHNGEPAGWSDFVSFWKELHTSHAESRGRGLAVLTESFASPTLARLAGLLRRRFPEALWATHDAVSQENVHRGLEMAAGRAYQAVHHFENAATVLAVDSDFLMCDPESVAQARGFAAGRRVGSETDSMNRLYVVESGYSLTGAMADHRMRLQSRRMGSFLAGLVRELASLGLDIPVPASPRPRGIDGRWLKVLARDLMDHAGRSLVLAGWGQPPAVHAAVVALNAALGNVGRTVSYHEYRDASPSSRQELGALARAMRSGEVRTLVMLGGNPVYNAPADLEFGAALADVEHSVHLSSHVDETSAHCEWHLPQAHYLEAWGDCRAVGGTLGVTQPLIEPLFGGRSAAEVLGLLESGEERPGYELVRDTWKTILREGDFETKWNRALHDGVLEGSEEPAASLQIQRSALGELGSGVAADNGGLEIVFRPSPAVFDGRFANIGWLQELPDTVTKLTWDNAAIMSPGTAAELGLENEDVVRLRYRGREIAMPVWKLPGHADRTVTVNLGYGRTASGRVGNGVGFNTYALRTSEAPDFDSGLELEKTGAKHPLASTQDHGTMAGRPVVREATLEEYRHHPEFAKEAVEHPPLDQMFGDHSYEGGYQWGMSIDLNVCTGCNACVIACQSENNIPVVGKEQVRRGREMQWIRVDRYFASEGADPADDPAPEMLVQPVPCMHCENAPCEQVCPVAATVHDAEGLNVMVYNRCIGTRYCSNNCPYKVRRFNFFNYTNDTPEIVTLAQNPDVTVRFRGVMEKCTYCTQRINAAKINAKLEGREVRDGDVQTACQQACPTNAIVFGDIRDPGSHVSKLKKQNRDYALLAELNNRPRTTYLAKLRNPHPELLES